PVADAAAHCSRYWTRGERSRGSQPMDGAQLRCKDAAHRPARGRRGAHRTCPRTDVWNDRVAGRLGIPRACGKHPRIAARGLHTSELFAALHSVEARHTVVHPDRGNSGCHTAADRLGGSARASRPGGLDALRTGVPLAVPALHVNRVDVSRRLRSRGLPGTSSRPDQNPIHDLSDRAAAPGSVPRHPASRSDRRAGHAVLCRRVAAGCWFLLLRCTVRAPAVWFNRAPAPDGIHHLSSSVAGADDACRELASVWSLVLGPSSPDPWSLIPDRRPAAPRWTGECFHTHTRKNLWPLPLTSRSPVGSGGCMSARYRLGMGILDAENLAIRPANNPAQARKAVALTIRERGRRKPSGR